MYTTREEWLNAALRLVGYHLRDTATVNVPAKTKVSCGLAGGRIGAKRIGECWTVTASPDGSTEVFISPEICHPELVLATLVHEAIHAAIGAEKGHRKEFRTAAIAAGLEGKMTATYAGEGLKAIINTWCGVLGDYPHSGLNASARKKQKTRLVKCECQSCGYTVRTTLKWLDQAGAPLCPCNNESMAVSTNGEDDE